MCALTFLPNNKNEFILTSNRDEGANRKPSSVPQILDIDGMKIMCPVDGEAGGSWFAVSEYGRAVCLLNGALIAHQHQPPYRISRGLMLLNSFKYESLKAFIDDYDFNGIEPFTFICFEINHSLVISDFRWDGKEKHFREINASAPLIWSSASLYTIEAQQKRKHWFEDWLMKNPEYRLETIREFHHFAGDGDEHDSLIMNRNNQVMTVSVTSLVIRNKEATMIYEDLQKNEIAKNVLPLRIRLDTPVG